MIALLCSGQGTQHRDMFRITATQAALPIWTAATATLGADPREVVIEYGDELLHANHIAQILCVTQALAAHALIADVLPSNSMVMGYSVGEVAACGIAGFFDVESTLELTRVRAAIMTQASGPDEGLAMVKGLPLATVEQLASSTGVEVAIVNPAQIIIVGGARSQLHGFCNRALGLGALRSNLLPVAVASHTSRFAKAAAALSAAITPLVTEVPRTRHGPCLLSSLDCMPVSNGEQVVDLLARQLCNCIDWGEALRSAIERGVRVVLELGPGSAQAEMVRAAFPEVIARSVDEFSTLEGLRLWLSRQP